MSTAKFVSLRVPLTDPRTGLISREWLMFLQALFNRSGGESRDLNKDLETLAAFDDGAQASSAAVSADLQAVASALDAAMATAPDSTAAVAALADALGALVATTETTGAWHASHAATEQRIADLQTLGAFAL